MAVTEARPCSIVSAVRSRSNTVLVPTLGSLRQYSQGGRGGNQGGVGARLLYQHRPPSWAPRPFSGVASVGAPIVRQTLPQSFAGGMLPNHVWVVGMD